MISSMKISKCGLLKHKNGYNFETTSIEHRTYKLFSLFLCLLFTPKVGLTLRYILYIYIQDIPVSTRNVQNGQCDAYGQCDVLNKNCRIRRRRHKRVLVWPWV